MLHTVSWGKGSRVVAIHGFTQSAEAWLPVAELLGDVHEVVAVDAPGHGRSAAVRAGLWDGAELIADAAGQGAYVGYSMGGRYALHVALRRPEAATRLVLVSTSAGIEDPYERAARASADEMTAERVERDGIPAFLSWWLAQPLFATLPAAAAGLDSRRLNTVEGLASSVRLAGTGHQEPLWDRLVGLAMPVLVVAGALDEAYTAHARRLVRSIGDNAELALIPGAGHACHLEKPEAWCEAVESFLAAE